MTEGTSQQFETTLQALEEVVKRLEQGDLSLEEQMREYERGVKLSGECSKLLKGAQLRLEQISESLTEDE